jgi:hypothetical protein
VFEQVIRTIATFGKQLCQATLDSLDARRPHIDEPITQADVDDMWPEYVGRSNDVSATEVMRFPFGGSTGFADPEAGWKLGEPMPEGVFPAGGWENE